MEKELFLKNNFFIDDPLLSREVPLVKSGVNNRFIHRLFMWNYFYHISKIFDFVLLLDTNFFPEGLFLDLPNTKFVDPSYLENKEYSILHPETIDKKISDVLESYSIPDSIENKTPHSLLKTVTNTENSIFNINGYECNLLCFKCSSLNESKLHTNTHDRLLNFVDIYSNWFSDVFSQIKFKNSRVNKFLSNNFSDVAGFQIRRGSGVKITKEYLTDLKKHVDPEIIKKYYHEISNIDTSTKFNIKILPDEYYFERIDKILAENVDKKIYMSYDVPGTFINHFIEKYSNNIITKQDFLEKYLSYFDKFDLENRNGHQHYLKKVLINLLDLFALCHSDALIFSRGPEYSLWPFFANSYKPKKIIY
jgi:hypothetical protein